MSNEDNQPGHNELDCDNPFSSIPGEVLKTKIETLSRMDAVRMTALGMAVRYYTETIIKDGSMYQQKKLEGANLIPAHHSEVLKIAISFERYLRGDFEDQISSLVDSDFELWLKDQVDKISLESKDEA